MKEKQKAVFYIILSALFFACMNTFVRLAGDIPSVQKSFFRNFVAVFFALIVMLKHKVLFTMKKGSLRYFLLRSAFGTLGILCNFYAVDHLALSDASMLNKMSPFFVLICCWLILGERLSVKQAVIVLMAFLGSLFVIKPTFSNMQLIPSLIGLGGGIFAGIAYAMVRILGKRGENGAFIVFFFSSFSCLVTLPYLLFCYTPMSTEQIFMLFAAGLAAAGGQFSITAAYCHAPAREISIYDYSQILFSAWIGWFLFDQVPDIWSVIGYLIIGSMAMAMFLLNKAGA